MPDPPSTPEICDRPQPVIRLDVVRTATLLCALRRHAETTPFGPQPDSLSAELWYELEKLAVLAAAPRGALKRLGERFNRSPAALKVHLHNLRRGFRPQYRRHGA